MSNRSKLRKAMRTLEHAFDYLRPRMLGDTLREVPVNEDAKAGSIIAGCLYRVSVEINRRPEGI